MNEYMEIYIAEAKELLDDMNGSLLKLDKNLTDTGLINSIFRDIHTIKGNSASMGFKKMESLSHSMEDVLQDIREGKVEVDSKIMELLFVCHDFLESGINTIMQTGNEEEMKIEGVLGKLHFIIEEKHEKMKGDVVNPLEQSLDGIDLTLSTQELYHLQKNMDAGFNAYLIKIKILQDCKFKSVRVWMWFQEMETYLKIIKSDPQKPTSNDIKNNSFNFEGCDIRLLAAAKDDTRSLLGRLNKLLDVENIYIEPVKLKDTDFMKSQIKLVMTKEALTAEASVGETEVIPSKENPPKDEQRIIEIESELSNDFVSEIAEQLSKLEAGLALLKEKPENNNALYKLSRIFHTIKGLAGFIDSRSIVKISIEAEQLMEYYRKGNLGSSGIKLQLFRDAAEFIRRLCTVKDGSENELADREAKLIGEIRNEIPSEENGETENKPFAETEPSVEHASSIGTKTAEEPSTITEIKPSVEHTSAARTKTTAEQALAGIKSAAEYASMADTKSVDGITSVSDRKQAGSAADMMQELHHQAEQGVNKSTNTSLENSFMRISAQKIDVLVDMLGELIIMHSLILKEASDYFDSNDKYMNNLHRMSKIIKEVQNLSMSLRMVSLKQTLQKTMRVGRDTAAELGKKADITIYGEDTEIDRNIADKLIDPLMHLVRNSVSHGIEEEEERTKKGKSATGKINIRAYSKRGYVYIEVGDDGKGLAIDRIRAKAVENNLIDPNGNYSTDEIMKFIFLPGFSTKEVVDNISGRGVGMNIVETEIKKVGGKIDIINKEGYGCTFVLKIPLNLAVMNGTIVDIMGGRYIIPTVYIKQFMKPEEHQWVTVKNKKTMLHVRDEILQVIPVEKLFGMEDAKLEEEESLVIIIEVEQKLKALPVRSIIGRQEIVAKPLEKELGGLDFISGASILGDGKVSLILDVESIFKISHATFAADI